jgi:hypothetical protein
MWANWRFLLERSDICPDAEADATFLAGDGNTFEDADAFLLTGDFTSFDDVCAKLVANPGPLSAVSSLAHLNRVAELQLDQYPPAQHETTYRYRIDRDGANSILRNIASYRLPEFEDVPGEFDHSVRILLFRALDPSEITNFPFAVYRLQCDLPNFELECLGCSDPAKWFASDGQQ